MPNDTLITSAVFATDFPEVHCNDDDRVQIDPMTSPPYSWTCSLLIEDHLGGKWSGTGFKIYIPEVTACVVVTSAHCLFIKGAYAKRITISFPGERDIQVDKQSDLRASQGFIDNPEEVDYDFGFIRLPDGSNEGFGWSATVSNEELDNLMVMNCGYPGDRRPGTLWITAGSISGCTNTTINYMDNRNAAQSGSPVYSWYNGYWTVLGVHSYGGTPNTARRFTQEMIVEYMGFANAYRSVAIRSVQFPDVYLRMDARGISSRQDTGGGVVNGQYKPASSWEGYYLWPVEALPSTAEVWYDEATTKYVLENKHFIGRYVRLDGHDYNKYDSNGGGTVNCQVSRQSDFFSKEGLEVFWLRKEQQDGTTFSLQSVRYPNCFLRLDGKEITSHMAGGGGNANLQFYEKGLPPKNSYEVFYVEDQS